MIELKDRADCCGCTACASICPRKAITMEEDALGFSYPHVDKSKCISCELCLKVCNFKEDYLRSEVTIEPACFAVRHRDIQQVVRSRSGAAFVALSDAVLERGGVVYGVALNAHFLAEHKRAESKFERDAFRGSKYIQSYLGDTFAKVKTDLSNGRQVLFSGTPCQVAGLNTFLGKTDKSNLILVDHVCHGVPSRNVWKDYMAYVEEKVGKRIVAVNFRDKDKGWKAHFESFTFENGEKLIANSFTYLFYLHIMLRPSCKKCHFCNYNRPSDITIGDFWGWERLGIDINADDKGLSLVMCNTDKGYSLFRSVTNQVLSFPCSKKQIVQPNLQRPSEFSKDTDLFEKMYVNKGFVCVLHRFGNVGVKYKFKCLVNRILKLQRKLFK